MFDQQREDPKGFYSSIAVIAGLVAVGAFLSGGRVGIVALIAVVVGILAVRKLRKS